MTRTHIHLGDKKLALLEEAARATGASRSALIRKAVRRTFGPLSKAEKLRALEVSAGSWSGRNFAGAEYVDAIRGDLNESPRAIRL